MKIRCSSLPIICQCPASASKPATSIRAAGDEAARLGSAVHWCLTERIAGRDGDQTEAAIRWDVPSDELGRLVAWGWNAWKRLESYFPEPEVEGELLPLADPATGIILSGHVDVISFQSPVVYILDLKTGRLDTNPEDQLRGYALLAMYQRPEIEEAHTFSLRVRSGDCDGNHYTRSQLDAWFDRLQADLTLHADEYRPGRHCSYCPRAPECPAKTILLQQAAWSILESKGDFLPADPLERGQLLVELHDRLRMVERAAETVRELIRAEVAAAGGTMRTIDGRELAIEEQERKSINFRDGWPVLEDSSAALEDLMAAVSISKTKVESAVKASAPNRKKGAVWQEMMERLERAGAITHETTTRLTVKRVPLSIMQESAT